MNVRLLAIAVSAAFSSTASAGVFDCQKPAPPWCLRYPFANFDEADACRAQMKVFTNDTDEYLKCTADQRREASEAADRAIREFNAMAQEYNSLRR